MHPVQKHLFKTNFADLEGTRIEGTVALSDELINLGLMDLVAKLKSGDLLPPTAAPTTSTAPAATHNATTPPSSPGTEPEIDAGAVLANLNIEQLKYRTQEGRTFLDLKAGFGES